MSKLVERLTKLVDVKSIMTLLLTGAFVFLVFRGIIDGDKFETIFLMVVSFYFGTQSEKNKQS